MELPRLTINQLLIQDLMAADPPCFALGYMREDGSTSGFLALRPETPIPSASTQQGFRFGHAAYGSAAGVALHFVFEFYGHTTYHGLTPTGNPLVQAVIARMIQTRDYFSSRSTQTTPPPPSGHN